MQNTILSATVFNQQAIDFHAHAAKQGFYEDYPTLESRHCIEFRCKAANLIHGEIHEAYDAFRSGKIDANEAVLFQLAGVMGEHGKELFKSTYIRDVKGTVAEELADAYIRTCDTIGAMGLIDFNDSYAQDLHNYLNSYNDASHGVHRLFTFALQSFDVTMGINNFYKGDIIAWFLAPIYALADYFKIDLHLHIKLKHFYNTTREYKHGRNF